MEWFFYAVALPFALLFLASAAYALYWAAKNGQLKEFEKNAASIFDDEEPVGEQTDYFPGRRPANETRR
ncbi:MAG: cbb3-type cytochrome oxidase assembly protein [Candidatus Synoicihabitans palmerolidicus]|nr:cbb3-type cytochrome oxidase assembly protein [Candidatus Synoicihabitans palmerolidicus]